MAYRPYSDLFSRLVANTLEPTGEQDCWVWSAMRCGGGYGRLNIYVDGGYAKLQAHIALWVLLEAKPENTAEFYMAYLTVTHSGLELDHMELVTAQENVRRRDARRAPL